MYTAVLIEPRKHKALEFCINNLLDNLNSDWNILVFHSDENQEYLSNIVKSSRVTLLNNIQNMNGDDYNKLLTSSSFYDSIPTDLFLITQTDAMIIPKNKDKISEFLEYDYVGAPWNTPGFFLHNLVGNGGFSLRRKSKMLDILKTVPYETWINEDVYFSMNTQNKPSFEKAELFSSETKWNPNSFGIHCVWKYIPNMSDIIQLIELNREYRPLKDAQPSQVQPLVP